MSAKLPLYTGAIMVYSGGVVRFSDVATNQDMYTLPMVAPTDTA